MGEQARDGVAVGEGDSEGRAVAAEGEGREGGGRKEEAQIEEAEGEAEGEEEAGLEEEVERGVVMAKAKARQQLELPGGPAPALGSGPGGSSNLLTDLLSLLMALRSLHWSSHWRATEYELHLLFERLYSGIDSEIDHLAEQIVFVYGGDKVDAMDLAEGTSQWLGRWGGGGDPGGAIATAIKAEDELDWAIGKVIEAMGDGIPKAIDNHLRGMADKHSTSRYLLKQVAGESEE